MRNVFIGVSVRLRCMRMLLFVCLCASVKKRRMEVETCKIFKVLILRRRKYDGVRLGIKYTIQTFTSFYIHEYHKIILEQSLTFSLAFTSAPPCTRRATTSVCPFSDAQCRGVL